MHIYFPAIKGSQGGFNYFSVQVSFKALGSSFIFDDTSLPIELRCQRELDISRARRFANYITDNPNSFVTGSVVGTVDSNVKFIPLDGPFSNGDVGVLQVSADYRIVLCDGQHRQKGIELALEAGANGSDTLPIILYQAPETDRKQQIFTDINANTVKPSSSLSMAFDSRSDFVSFIKDVAKSNPAIYKSIDFERNSVGSKSLRLWPLVSFKSFICNLTCLSEKSFSDNITNPDSRAKLVEIVSSFLSGLNNLPYWSDMLGKRVNLTELRQDTIVSHAVFLEALGHYGAHLLQHFQEIGAIQWSLMENLSNVDVSKSNWVGRCVSPQHTIVKNQFGIKSTAAKICRDAGIPTSQMLDDVENKFK